MLAERQLTHGSLTHHPTGRTRFRYASQSGWMTLPFGAPLYVAYDSAE